MAGKKQIVILKHAESCEKAAGSGWLSLYDESGRMNLLEGDARKNFQPDGNLPLHLPVRKGPKSGWQSDAPLTTMGIVATQEVGRHITLSKAINVKDLGSYIYCSPCLCCLQTANTLLNTMGVVKSPKIRAEPALCNFKQHHQAPSAPNYYTTKEFATLGIDRLDSKYAPILALKAWKPQEELEDFYKRQKAAAKKLSSEHDGRILMIIAHGSNFYALANGLRNLPAPDWTTKRLIACFRNIPNLACCCLQSEGQDWTLVNAPVPSFACAGNCKMSWDLWHSDKDFSDWGELY